MEDYFDFLFMVICMNRNPHKRRLMIGGKTKKFVSPMKDFVPGKISREEQMEILNYYVKEYEKRNGGSIGKRDIK